MSAPDPMIPTASEQDEWSADELDVISRAYYEEGFSFAQACWTVWHNLTCKPCNKEAPW